MEIFTSSNNGFHTNVFRMKSLSSNAVVAKLGKFGSSGSSHRHLAWLAFIDYAQNNPYTEKFNLEDVIDVNFNYAESASDVKNILDGVLKKSSYKKYDNLINWAKPLQDIILETDWNSRRSVIMDKVKDKKSRSGESRFANRLRVPEPDTSLSSAFLEQMLSIRNRSTGRITNLPINSFTTSGSWVSQHTGINVDTNGAPTPTPTPSQFNPETAIYTRDFFSGLNIQNYLRFRREGGAVIDYTTFLARYNSTRPTTMNTNDVNSWLHWVVNSNRSTGGFGTSDFVNDFRLFLSNNRIITTTEQVPASDNNTALNPDEWGD